MEFALYQAPDQAVIAYTAGLLDGEGSIYVPSRLHQERGQFRIEISQSVTNGGEQLFRGLQREWDGIGSVRLRPVEHGLCDAWTWRLDRINEAEFLLRTCLPYLRVKRARAEAALAEFHGRKGERFRGPWALRELQFVRDNPDLTAIEIARVIRRSVNAIIIKRREIGAGPGRNHRRNGRHR